MGGEPWQLIEPVDGFHPSQVKTPPQEMGGSTEDVGAYGMPVTIGAPGIQLVCHKDADLGNLSILKERES